MAGNTYTSDDLLNLNGVRQRVDTYRFELVDAVNNRIGTIQPSRDQPPTITNDTTRSVFRTLEGFWLDAEQQASLATMGMRVRPSLVLQNGSAYPLGVFLFGDASRGRRSWGLDLSASLVDQLFILNQPIGRVVGFDIGQNVVDAAVSIAAEVITSPQSIVVSSQTLAAPIAWKLQDTRAKIINDLLRLVGYLPVYFDNSGNMVMKPTPAMPLTVADFTYAAGGRIIKDSIVETDDLLKAANRYIVVETGAQAGPIVGVFDLPGSAPNSIANRGFPVVKVAEMQGLADVTAATLAAQALAATDPQQYRKAQFDSTHDPRHDTFCAVSFLGNLHREIGWHVQCRSGARMTHSLLRSYA